MESQHSAHSLQSQMHLQPQAPMHSHFSLQSQPSTQAQQVAGRPAMAISNPFSDLTQTSMGEVPASSGLLRMNVCPPQRPRPGPD